MKSMAIPLSSFENWCVLTVSVFFSSAHSWKYVFLPYHVLVSHCRTL